MIYKHDIKPKSQLQLFNLIEWIQSLYADKEVARWMLYYCDETRYNPDSNKIREITFSKRFLEYVNKINKGDKQSRNVFISLTQDGCVFCVHF